MIAIIKSIDEFLRDKPSFVVIIVSLLISHPQIDRIVSVVF